MDEYDLEKVMKALQNADAAATNAETPEARAEAAADARRLATIAKRLRSGGGPARDDTGTIPNNSKIGFFNQAVADTVDFINPFDNPAWENIAGGRFKTPSARDMMRDLNVAVAERPPETVTEGFARGAGDAAIAFAPVTKGLQLASRLPGVAGRVADTAYKGMATTGGAVAEVGAGAVAGGAGEVAEAAGASPAMTSIVELLAPSLGLTGAVGGARALGRVGSKVIPKLPLPGLQAARSFGNAAKAALTPMTEGGARQVAREELVERVGPDRAAEVAGRIDPNDTLGLSPAQMTGDPRLLALEGSARGADPELDAWFIEQGMKARKNAATEVAGMGGAPAQARPFLKSRLADYRSNMKNAVERVMGFSDERIANAGPNAPGSANSARVASRLRSELDDAKFQNDQLWASVPLEEVVPVNETRSVYRAILSDTPRAQMADVPRIASLIDEFGDAETAKEMHGLYSELRRISRAAKSGEPGKRNNNLARISDMLADAILVDLGKVDKSTPVGARIADALDHTRAMHETFDQGAPGLILSRKSAGDDRVPEMAALDKTLGRGGPVGADDYDRIVKAAPGTQAEMGDFLRSQFMDKVMTADGRFSERAGLEWLRRNRDVMMRFPGLEREFRGVIGDRTRAEAFMARAAVREKLADKSFAHLFTGDSNRAVRTILQSEDPAEAARGILRTVSKDPDGKALEGVKGAFSNFLIRESTTADGALAGGKFEAMITDPSMNAALKTIFSEGEMDRMRRISDAIKSVDASGPSGAPIIDRPANTLLKRIVQVMAARAGGKLGSSGGMGGSLQTANIFVSTADRMLARLTNERAQALLMDAVKDPALMRELLTEVPSAKIPESSMRTLAPYITGAAAATGGEERMDDPARRPGILGPITGGSGALGAIIDQLAPAGAKGGQAARTKIAEALMGADPAKLLPMVDAGEADRIRAMIVNALTRGGAMQAAPAPN